MISVTEAKRLLHAHVKPLETVVLPLQDAAGCVLAADIFAPADLPLAAQAAMDGYAFKFANWKGQPLAVHGVIAAGDATEQVLQQDGTVRIFTGAYLPAGADTVVIQEKTKLVNGNVLIEDNTIEAGANIRLGGSEIKKGTLGLPKHLQLTPGAIGFLAMMGVSEVPVVPKPKIALLVTGKELQPPGTPPQKGKVYEANSYTLQAALQQLGIRNILMSTVADTLEATASAIDNAIEKADVLLITGGISVGDFDFVLPATVQCGIEKVFHKVAQKPGKPLFFGMKGIQPVFGLPGNPASVLTCFYQYVVPALRFLMHQEAKDVDEPLPLLQTMAKKAGLTHFLKGRITKAGVNPLPAQESFRLSSFAIADCLIELPEPAAEVEAGTLVNVFRFSHTWL